MFTVLIAEDERRVAEIIFRLIPWDELGLKLVSTVNNGRDALKIICEQKPDIVITDLRMPEVEGLEVIKEVKEKNIDTNFIIISGYRYFEYAQSALKYGVFDYLVKPIQKDELIQTLEKIIKQKKEKLEKDHTMQQMHNTINQSMSLLKKDFLEKVRSNAISDLDIQQVNEKYACRFQRGFYCGLILRLDRRPLVKEDIVVENMMMNHMEVMLEASLEGAVIEKRFLCDKTCILGVVNTQPDMKSNLTEKLDKVFASIQDYVGSYGNFHITIAQGMWQDKIAGLAESMNQAQECMLWRIKVGTDRKITYSSQKYRSFDMRGSMEENRIQIENAVDSLDPGLLISIMTEKIKSAFSQEDISPAEVYRAVIWMIHVVEQRLVSLTDDALKQYFIDFVDELDNAYSVNYFMKAMSDNIGKIFSYCKEKQKLRNSRPVREAQKYIQENYQNKITLEDIAALVDLNPVYFSVIFKKETGCGFNEFLINTRIKMAKHFLKTTKDNVAVIAEQVGYKDEQYFYKIFRNTVGITPKQYRKLYS